MKSGDGPFQCEEHFNAERFILRPHLQPARTGTQLPQRLFISDSGFKEQHFKLKGEIGQVLEAVSPITLRTLFSCRIERERGELKQPFSVLPQSVIDTIIIEQHRTTPFHEG